MSIPEGLTEISSFAFANSGLISIVIPPNVTKIGTFAFANCTNLKKITISDHVTEIGAFAFCACTSLTDIVIPDSVTIVGSQAFSNCTSLNKVTAPNGASISKDAFFNTPWLERQQVRHRILIIAGAVVVMGTAVAAAISMKKKEKPKKKWKKWKKQKKEKVNIRTSSQEPTSTVNPTGKYKDRLTKALKWFVVTILGIILGLAIAYFFPVLTKHFQPISPSLSASLCDISGIYHATITGDTSGDNYLAFQVDETEQLSLKLTNNDESTLVVNDIYLDLIDYQPDVKVTLSPGKWGGGTTTPVFYGVQLGNMCQKYRCTWLDKESANYFSSHHEFPTVENIKVISEQIEHNKTDEIEIIIFTKYPGKYRFKIIIEYTIRNFNNSIESDEFSFILLDSNSTS